MMSLILPRYAPALAAAIALLIGLFVAGHNIYDRGVAHESARRDVIEAQAERATQARLAELNKQVLVAQANLDHANGVILAKQKEIDHEKAASADLQSDLAAGRRRLSVAITGACHPAAASTPQGAAAGAVDPAGAVTADLDGRAAADLEWLRQTRNDALTGLSACITSYDAVRAAADGAGKDNP